MMLFLLKTPVRLEVPYLQRKWNYIFLAGKTLVDNIDLNISVFCSESKGHGSYHECNIEETMAAVDYT